MTRLPTTVIVLGLVSLLNDMASDMIAPLLPLFLAATMGAGPAVVGLIEGVAETTSSLLKLWAGRLGDRGVGHKRLALGGYAVSNLLRPLIAFATSWPMVLVLRFGDRIGKGLRTAPRDALLAAAVVPQLRGRAFGLHRAMNHSGAMAGPLIAAALLAQGMELRTVFLWSAIPGALVVLLLAFGVKEERAPAQPLAPLRWTALPPDLRRLIVAAGALALAAIPDAFLVLWLDAAQVPVAWIPALWAAAHGLRALVSLPAGRLSDRVGRLPILIGGWLLRALLLLIVPWISGIAPVIALFFLYAMATATTEGAERALIGDLAAPQLRGTAFGLYHLTVGVLALPGALWFGAVWQAFDMHTAFVAASIVTLAAAFWFAQRVRGVRH